MQPPVSWNIENIPLPFCELPYTFAFAQPFPWDIALPFACKDALIEQHIHSNTYTHTQFNSFNIHTYKHTCNFGLMSSWWIRWLLWLQAHMWILLWLLCRLWWNNSGHNVLLLQFCLKASQKSLQIHCKIVDSCPMLNLTIITDVYKLQWIRTTVMTTHFQSWY